ncbi:MAG: adenosylcobinamide-GDP ribazoletransferase [Tissierellales bacterium]|nr:adenosylcobinamide-GDP ribazoletransferase [Tissierellales bacterium]
MRNLLFNSSKSILLMITFFTRIPIKLQSEFDDNDYKLGIILLPIIGIVIGIGLLILKIFTFISSTYVLGLILTLFYLWISGGLHLDGLGDTLDGLFSGR